MTMRAARTDWKTYALGTAVLAALLSTTACESDGKDNASAPTPSTTPSATGGSTEPGSGESGAADGSQVTDDSGSDSSGGSGGTDDSATGTAACAAGDVSVSATLYPHDEARHMLLTVTNTGDRKCTLYRYPIVRFDSGREDQVGPLESAMDDVTIAPGAKAYAGMLLFRIGAPTDAVETVTVSLQGPVSNEDPDSAPVKVTLPDEAPFLNIDDNPGVSYWNASREKAEDYMFKAAGGN
ncbi:DUF4232 domain-containing protein [Streptomyces sp. NPDC051940]|uniref:DUF4232 domain-containing protein n=1 Tax=Streptomyces sp. NPDC051940 TaxID=3155675 RepID=UPI003412B38F